MSASPSSNPALDAADRAPPISADHVEGGQPEEYISMAQFKKSMQLVRLQIAVPISGAYFQELETEAAHVY